MRSRGVVRLNHPKHTGMCCLLHSPTDDALPSREDIYTRNLKTASSVSYPSSKIINDPDGARGASCHRNRTVNPSCVQLGSWDSNRKRSNLACESPERFHRHCTALKNGFGESGKLCPLIFRDEKRLKNLVG